MATLLDGVARAKTTPLKAREYKFRDAPLKYNIKYYNGDIFSEASTRDIKLNIQLSRRVKIDCELVMRRRAYCEITWSLSKFDCSNKFERRR